MQMSTLPTFYLLCSCDSLVGSVLTNTAGVLWAFEMSCFAMYSKLVYFCMSVRANANLAMHRQHLRAMTTFSVNNGLTTGQK